jgi:cell wall-associated NlpC family hydrolase
VAGQLSEPEPDRETFRRRFRKDPHVCVRAHPCPTSPQCRGGAPSSRRHRRTHPGGRRREHPAGVHPGDAATIEGRALTIAASKHGDPYEWGAKGPNAFDCSGLIYYAFRHAGRALPRTAQEQYDSVEHISRRSLRPGDLVFFHYGDDVYHVGIYAGHNRIWHAPYPGAYVRLERIWTSQVWYGRIG